MRKLVIGLAMASSALASPTLARDGAWYVGVQGGPMIVEDIDIDPAAASFQIVISGHSHKPGIETRNGVTYLNPGSIGPRRFNLPISMAALTVTATGFTPELITLDV